jgi:hypothetical protein
MKKDEAELAIRARATKWFDTFPEENREHPSWYAFKEWPSANLSARGEQLTLCLARAYIPHLIDEPAIR